MTKNTYGTGSFLLMNTGSRAVISSSDFNNYRLGSRGSVEYALEGSIFITGAAIQWLRDGLGLIEKASQMETLASQVSDNGGVSWCRRSPAWGRHTDPYARGLIIGITGGTTRAHVARAVVEAMAYQTRDVLEIMRSEAAILIQELRVDGGASVMDLLLQFQADITDMVVVRSASTETTAQGAAFLAGLAAGIWKNRQELFESWRAGAQFKPRMPEQQREALYNSWRKAVQRSLDWVGPDAEEQ